MTESSWAVPHLPTSWQDAGYPHLSRLDPEHTLCVFQIHPMSNSDVSRSWSPYTHDRRPSPPKGPRPRTPSPSLHTSKHSFCNPDATINPTILRLSSLSIRPPPSPTPKPTRESDCVGHQHGHHRNELAAENAVELRELRQESPMTDIFACAPPAPGCLVNSVAPVSARYMVSEEAPHSPPELATSPFSPPSSLSLSTPRNSLCFGQTVAFNAPLLTSAWRSSTGSFSSIHTRSATSSSTTSTTSSIYSSDASKSPARLPIGRVMGPRGPRTTSISRDEQRRAQGNTSEAVIDRATSLSSIPWRRPQLSKIDTQRTLRPSSHIPLPVQLPYYSARSPLLRANAGLGLSEGEDLFPAATTTSDSSSSELGPLSAAVSAGTLSPLEDTSLTVCERRARRRQGVDFHSHAKLVDIFQLSEVEPDYMFGSADLGGSPDRDIELDESGREDAHNSDLDRPDDDMPSVLFVMMDSPPEERDEDEDDLEEVGDFSWEAEESDDEEQEFDHADHPEVCLRRDNGKAENSDPMTFEEGQQLRQSPTSQILSPVIDAVSSSVKPSVASPLVAPILRASSSISDAYDFLADTELEPVPHSPDDQELFTLDLNFDLDGPQSAFSDSEDECGSDGDSGILHFHSYRIAPHRYSHVHARRRSAGSTSASTSAFGKKFRALKASMSRTSLKSQRNIPRTSTMSSSVSSISSHSPSYRPHGLSPLSSPMATQLSLPPQDGTSVASIYTASHSHRSSIASSSVGYISSSGMSSSHDAPCAPPSIPLPPVPPHPYARHILPPRSAEFIYTDTSSEGSHEFNPYLVEVDGSKYRMTVVDPDTSMSKLELSMEKLKAHMIRLEPEVVEVKEVKPDQEKQEEVQRPLKVALRIDTSPSVKKTELPAASGTAPLVIKKASAVAAHISEWRFPAITQPQAEESSHAKPLSNSSSLVTHGRKVSFSVTPGVRKISSSPGSTHGQRPSFNFLPLFDFEQGSPSSPLAESRSSRQYRLSKQLRRTSSLMEINDLRQLLNLDSEETSPSRSTNSSPAASSSDEHIPCPSPLQKDDVVQQIPAYKPQTPISRPLSPPPSSSGGGQNVKSRVIPFLHRPVRSERFSGVPSSFASPPNLNPPRRPSFSSPMKTTQLRIRTLSSRASEMSSGSSSHEGPLGEETQAQKEKGLSSRTRRFWDRVGVYSYSEKRGRIRGSIDTSLS